MNIKIFGSVQGVGFRDAAYWKARKLYIAGFIMNEPDSSLYIEAEGEETALNEFLTWCNKGPLGARVDRVESAWSAAVGKFTGFRIG